MKTTETKEKLAQHVQDLGAGTRQAGRNLWLAGLGVASSVETESRELFNRWVDRGREQPVPKITVPEPLRAVGEQVKSFGRSFEQRVEGSTSAALKRFGVPDRREVHALIERIELLTRKVEDLAEARN